MAKRGKDSCEKADTSHKLIKISFYMVKNECGMELLSNGRKRQKYNSMLPITGVSLRIRERCTDLIDKLHSMMSGRRLIMGLLVDQVHPECSSLSIGEEPG